MLSCMIFFLYSNAQKPLISFLEISTTWILSAILFDQFP